MSGRDGRDGRDGVDGIGRPGPRGGPGPQGYPGKSAYEIAVLRGFTGTEREWIESLKAKDGRNGRDAIDGKQGEVGPRGPQGPKGDLGDMPRHEWEGTKLRFEQGPNGERWGEFVDLKGEPGAGGAGDISRVGGGIVVIPGSSSAPTNSWNPAGW